MPQLDFVSYFPQIAWVLFLFIVLFISVLQGFLPVLGRVFWFREFKKFGFSVNSSFVKKYTGILFFARVKLVNFLFFFSTFGLYFRRVFVKEGVVIKSVWLLFLVMIKRVFKNFRYINKKVKVNKVVRFLGREYSRILPLSNVLNGVQGFNSFGVKLLCKQFNIPINLPIGLFKDVQLVELKTVLFSGSFLSSYLGFDDNRRLHFSIGKLWKKAYINSFFKMSQIGFLRFGRLLKGLPVRGQRTKTNASTCRRSSARSFCLVVSV
jgi:ribosomal protein S13